MVSTKSPQGGPPDPAPPTHSSEPEVIPIDGDDPAEIAAVDGASGRQDGEQGRQPANGGDKGGQGLDGLLSDQILTLRNEKGRFVKVKDTERNRRRQQEAMSKLGTLVSMVEEDNDGFAEIVDSDDDKPTRQRTEAITDDDSQQVIHQITLGTACVDVRHLQLEWKDDTGMTQRPVEAHHVDKLKEAFAIGVQRVDYAKRLYVSMTQADLKSAVKVSAEKQGLRPALLMEAIRDGESEVGGAYTSIPEVPRLIMPIIPELAHDGRVTCRVEAGQHRVLALKEFAREHLPEEVVIEMDDLVSDESSKVTMARQWYGWVVTILDAEEIVKQVNRCALAVIRRNPEDVYAKDSEGVLFSTAITHFNKLGEDDREMALRDFPEFCRRFLKTNARDAKRLKRIFKAPVMRDIIEVFTASAWGRGLYSQSRLEQMVVTRVVKLIETVVTEAMVRVSEVVEPGNMPNIRKHLPNRHTDAANKVSLNDLEAISECFTPKGLVQSKWLQLFYPVEGKNVAEVDSLRKLNYSKHVQIPDNRMPVNSDGEREGRHYRRPYFLSFLKHDEYHCVFRYNRDRATEVRLATQPVLPGPNDVFLPTSKWFSRFCETDLPRFCAALRLHWFCAAPEQYKNITSFGSNATGKNVEDKFDIGITFRSHHRAWRCQQAEANFGQELRFEEEDEEDEGGNQPTSSRNRVAKAVQRLQGQRHEINSAITKAAADGEAKFDRYLVQLFTVCANSKHSVKEFLDACYIGYDYVYEVSIHRRAIFKFYRQIIDNRFIRPTFTDAFFPTLGEGYLAGIAKVLALKDIDTDRNGHAIGFFDIKAPTILDTQASTVSAIEQFAPFKGLKKKEKAELEDKLAPWVDIFVNSLYLARNGKLLYSLLEHVQQLELTPPIDWEAAAIWKGQAFIANNAQRLQIIQAMSDCIDRLSNHWSISSLAEHNWWTFVELHPNDQLKLLPHSGAISVDPRVNRPDGKAIVPAPPAKDAHFQYEEEIKDWFEKNVQDQMPYDLESAEYFFDILEEEKQKNKRKNDAAKANRQAKAAGSPVKATGGQAKTAGRKRKQPVSAEFVDFIDDADATPAPSDDDASADGDAAADGSASVEETTASMPLAGPPPRKRQRTAPQATKGKSTPKSAGKAKATSIPKSTGKGKAKAIPRSAAKPTVRTPAQPTVSTPARPSATATAQSASTQPSVDATVEMTGVVELTEDDNPVSEVDTPSRANQIPSLRDLDWSYPNQEMPQATIEGMAKILNIPAKNRAAWATAGSLQGKELSAHTYRAQTERLNTVRTLVAKQHCNWVVQRHSQLPPELQYVSKAAWEKQQKKALATTPHASTKNRKAGKQKQ